MTLVFDLADLVSKFPSCRRRVRKPNTELEEFAFQLLLKMISSIYILLHANLCTVRPVVIQQLDHCMLLQLLDRSL
jgi:hypothetical protein